MTMLDLRQTAARLCVHVDTVRREIKRGNLQARRIGLRKLMVDEVEIERYLRAKEYKNERASAKDT